MFLLLLLEKGKNHTFFKAINLAIAASTAHHLPKSKVFVLIINNTAFITPRNPAISIATNKN
jgi:hypothetical protein